jgi:hypothetical protein
MSESAAMRAFQRELSKLLGKLIKVSTEDKIYTGLLQGYHPGTLSVCLDNAVAGDEKFHKVFIAGSRVLEIALEEEPFNLAGLAEELNRIFPQGGVQLDDETGFILVLDRVKVTEKVLRERDPLLIE